MTFTQVKHVWLKVKEKQQELFNFLVLHVVYLVGIGLTSLFAKIVGKHFLNPTHKVSSWQKGGTTAAVEPDHMY